MKRPMKPSGTKRKADSREYSVRRTTHALRRLVDWCQSPADSESLAQATEMLRRALPLSAPLGPMSFSRLVSGHVETEGLRQEFAASLDAYLAAPGMHPHWTVPSNALPLVLDELSVIPRQDGGAALLYSQGAWPAAFWLTVAAVMQSGIHLIRRCACGQPFVRVRKQKRCTPQCGQRARSKRWYDSNRGIALERKHDAYEARVKTTLPKAKVMRRPRRRSLQQLATVSLTGGRKRR